MKAIVTGIVAATTLTVLAMVAIILVGVLLGWPMSLRDQFCLTNSSGRPIVVTSHHTGELFSTGKGTTVVVPHSSGSIVVKQQDGKTWTYEELSVMDLHRTPYA